MKKLIACLGFTLILSGCASPICMYAGLGAVGGAMYGATENSTQAVKGAAVGAATGAGAGLLTEQVIEAGVFKALGVH